MTKKSVLALILLLIPVFAGAQTPVPHYLNFQSVVMDDFGNILTDSFVNLNFKILDKDGNLVYEEDQKSVQIVKGAINVMIGEGTIPNSSPASPTGGIPMNALDPGDGTHFLRVTIGNNQPLADMELLSTPYAMYAEQALSIIPNSIGSEEIKDGSIKFEDLEPGLAFSNLSGTASESQLPTSLATDTELNAHLNSTTAHKAENITVRGPYLSSDDPDLESVLIALDRRVMNFYNNSNEFLGNETTLREAAETTLQTNIDTEATTRATADTAEATAREATDTTLQSNIDAEATTRSLADSTLQTNIDNEATTRSDADADLLDSIADEALVRSAADTALDLAKVNRAGDTMTGDLQVNANIGVTGTVDGVDVSLLSSNFTNHSDSTSVHGSNGNVVGQNTLNSAVTTLDNDKLDKAGDVMSGDLNMGTKNITNVGTVDGVDVASLNTAVSGGQPTSHVNRISDNETRIDALENDTTLEDVTILSPFFLKPSEGEGAGQFNVRVISVDNTTAQTDVDIVTAPANASAAAWAYIMGSAAGDPNNTARDDSIARFDFVTMRNDASPCCSGGISNVYAVQTQSSNPGNGAFLATDNSTRRIFLRVNTNSGGINYNWRALVYYTVSN